MRSSHLTTKNSKERERRDRALPFSTDFVLHLSVFFENFERNIVLVALSFFLWMSVLAEPEKRLKRVTSGQGRGTRGECAAKEHLLCGLHDAVRFLLLTVRYCSHLGLCFLSNSGATLLEEFFILMYGILFFPPPPWEYTLLLFLSSCGWFGVFNRNAAFSCCFCVFPFIFLFILFGRSFCFAVFASHICLSTYLYISLLFFKPLIPQHLYHL